jgi:HTH-type transcriptional regulator / antitoxin HipB
VFIRRPVDIGEIVRSTRQARRLNQQDLADRLGVSRTWINEIEGGKPTVRLDLVLRALNELQITLAAYADGEIGAKAAALTPRASGPIDIDAIADRGLPFRNAGRRAQKRRRR